MHTFFWMMGTLLSFCFMAIAARELSEHIGTFQILFFRSLIGLAIVTLIIFYKKDLKLFRSRRLKLHLSRNLCHFAGQYGWFLGLGLLPLANVFALEFTTPLWTAVIAAIFLKERLTLKKSLAILLGLLAVIIIVKPSSDIFNHTSLIVLAAALFYALAHVFSKSLSSTEKPVTLLFYMCLIQLPIGLVFTILNWQTPNLIQWGWLSIVGITALTAHYCINRAMLLSEISLVVTLDFLRLPIIALLGIVIYAEDFQVSICIGGGLMLLGNLINLYPLKIKRSE